MVGLLNSNGDQIATYVYDAWGNCQSFGEDPTEFYNPLRYRGYVYDEETGLYYLQSRYYDPGLGRFLNADALTSTGQGLTGNNMFAYCGNNPIAYTDKYGERQMIANNTQVGGFAYSDADLVILQNADIIVNAAEKYNIDPYVLAGCIHVEQSENYDLIDVLTDVPAYFLDTSVGVSQVKISTVLLLEKNGYIDGTGSGNSKNWEIAKRLSRDSTYNIDCAAAYLSYLQMRWDGNYDVTKDPSIWGTLYNRGEGTPHPNPGANKFGEIVARRYWYMEVLLN